jgi:ribosomal protein S17
VLEGLLDFDHCLLLAVDVKAFNSLNTKQAVIEIEQPFKHRCYNKVLVKHKLQLNKRFKIKELLQQVN